MTGSDGKASVYNAGDPGSIPGLGRSLEKEMAICSSTIAWKIPWTEEQEIMIRNTELISHHQPEEFGKGLKETLRVRPLPRIPLANIHLG